MKKTLRLILGDQLNGQHSWFKDDEHCVYVMMEMRQETDYVRHHVQKILAFFLAMRSFAEELQSQGKEVIYLSLDDPDNQHDLEDKLRVITQKNNIEKFEYQAPDEYRLDLQLRRFCDEITLPSKRYSSEHFSADVEEFEELFKGKKTYLMETFYRFMRRKHGVLMVEDQPLTGKWNYDHDNRNKLPKNHRPPEPLTFSHDVSELKKMIDTSGVKFIGNVNEKQLLWPKNRQESLQLLDFFVDECLPLFGKFQDSMTTEYWSVYHSRISFSLNTKMISPLEVIDKVEQRFYEDENHAGIAQVEGFIRQILGWREYMRCIYWMKMPGYADLNFLEHERALPSFFWTGKTKMKCIAHAVQQSLDYAYAHHIQRLMVTGNFALLAGIHPDEVDQWYLGIYIDAIEWVEITNTRGMSQFADGGIVGTKPYVSSANYFKKMGNYCSGCKYNPDLKAGEEGACPFNVLYWHFYDRHEEKLKKNPRIGMAYRTWDKMGSEKKAQILERAELYLNDMENL